MNETVPSPPRDVIPLENIRVASPCRADWDAMEGDHRARFCGTCQKNVYNLSAMSKADAEKLITDKEGKLCVQYYQREDGTILTDDCSIVLKIARRPFKFLTAGFAVLMASGVAIFAQQPTTPSSSGASLNCNSQNVGFARAVLNRFDSDNSVVRGKPIIRGEPGPVPAPTPTPEPTPEPEE